MEQQTIEQRIAQLKKITPEDGDVEYSQAQFELGVIYYSKLNDWQQAESYFNKVEKQSDSEAYTQAQFFLGFIYLKKNEIEKAESYFNKVEKQSAPKTYAQVQFLLGFFYLDKKDEIEKAESYFNKVEKKSDSKAYAQAQFFLGFIYLVKKDEIEKAESYFNKVEKQSDSEVYEQAQYRLAYIYYAKEKIEQANQCLLNCCDSTNVLIFNPANYLLGDNQFFSQKTINNIKLATEYYQKVIYSDRSFKSYVIAQIMLTIINNGHHSLFKNKAKRNKLVIDPIYKIRKLTNDIQKQLLVIFKLGDSIKDKQLELFESDKSIKDQQQQFERQVAHYTRAGVLFNLLKNEPSDFRLNVIDFMNDPTENQVLTSWLGIKTDPNNDIKSFLASFSFNHNSLNQFRLYGNENNIVGSSVSMVFNQHFFGDNAERSINSEAINLLSEKIAFQKASNDFIANSDTAGSNDSINQNNTTCIYPLPLFRCLYFDPNSEYISIAKRSKFSFYLEHQGCSSVDIEAKWAEYIELLEEQNKIDTIRNLLDEIKVEIQKLKASEELKVFTNLDQLITLALMPISCLIKHAAFEDEDECRVIYITNIADEKIQAPTDYALANSLFVNYNKVEDFLEKIYLGPQCPPYHKLWITNHFRTSKSKTRSKAIKVVQSEMPLR